MFAKFDTDSKMWVVFNSDGAIYKAYSDKESAESILSEYYAAPVKIDETYNEVEY